MSEYPCDQPISVNITLTSGECTVIAEQRDTAAVTIEPYKRDNKSKEAAELTKVDFTDGRLTIRGPEGVTGWLLGRGSGSIDVTVRVPMQSSVSVKSATAPLWLRGRLAKVSATTASGPIEVEQAAECSVNTASGDIHVTACHGPANANTVSGDLQIDHVTGDIRAKSVSGDVRIEHSDGSVQANSVSGDITLGSVRTGLCKVNSVSGSLAIGIPSGTGVWMDLNSISGTTSSDLAIGDMPTDSPKSNMEIRATSVSGDIEIFRANTR